MRSLITALNYSIFLVSKTNTTYVNNEKNTGKGYTLCQGKNTVLPRAPLLAGFVCIGLCPIPSHLEQCQAGSRCSMNIWLLNKESTYLAPEEPGRCQTLGWFWLWQHQSQNQTHHWKQKQNSDLNDSILKIWTHTKLLGF